MLFIAMGRLRRLPVISDDLSVDKDKTSVEAAGPKGRCCVAMYSIAGAQYITLHYSTVI